MKELVCYRCDHDHTSDSMEHMRGQFGWSAKCSRCPCAMDERAAAAWLLVAAQTRANELALLALALECARLNGGPSIESKVAVPRIRELLEVVQS